MAVSIAVNLEDRMRGRIYKGLLLFIILAGLPTIAIPKLHNRLNDRIRLLRTAWIQNELTSIAQTGANANPFPREYERPAAQNGDETQLPGIANFVFKPKAPVSEGSPFKVIKVLPNQSQPKSPAIANYKTTEMGRVSAEDPANSIPQYRQGKNEKEAYDLVLKLNKILAAMVQGGNPSLRLKTWGAAWHGEDSYLVRVIFLNQEKMEIEYIWQVNLASGAISPLSHNARSIS
jgi:hypothetical protein